MRCALAWGLVVVAAACGGGSPLSTDGGVADSATAVDGAVADGSPVDAGARALTVEIAGSGAGTVSSSPAGIACGSSCTSTFASDVVLTAEAGSGSVLVGWSEASCAGATCTVPYAALPRAVTATFAPFDPADIVVSPGTLTIGPVLGGDPGSGTLVVQNTGTVAVPIESIVLTSGFTIGASSTCGDVLAAGTSCSVDVEAATAAGDRGEVQGTADLWIAGVDYGVFLELWIGEYFTVTLAGSGQGTVTSDPPGIDCPGTCTTLLVTPLELTATAPLGNVFSGWSQSGTDCTTSPPTCQVLPGSITATFSPAPVYTVGVTVTGLTSGQLVLQDNGSDDLAITADGSYTFATPVTSTTPYQVIATRQPATEGCAVFHSGGTMGSANVTDVAVACGPHAWKSIATGGVAACGLHADGTLWCWGSGYLDVPTQVGTATWDAMSESPGSSLDTCALKSGTLWCWGDNSNGQLGNGTTGGSDATPSQVPSAHPWLVVSASRSPCGIQSDGSLWCWGLNNAGQLGIGTLVDKSVPTQVGSDHDWTAVSSGGEQTCGIKSGQLWCWGGNLEGEVGDGTRNNRARPFHVGTATWRSVSAGDLDTCGIQTDGTLWCWGLGGWGQLGDGGGTRRLTPVQAGTATSWASVAASGDATCGTQTDGSLWCWGSYLVGDGVDHYPGFNAQLTPLRIQPAKSWAAVATSGTVACAIATDHSLWCWGPSDGVSGIVAPATLTPIEVAP